MTTTEPSKPEPDRCAASEWGLRCALKAGHPGDHEAGDPGHPWVWTNEEDRDADD